MLKYIYIIPFIAISLFLTSCYEDKGNYDYNEVNELSFDGFEENYSVFSYENLNITPTINATLDTEQNEDRYSYRWVASTFSDATELATTRNLDITVDLLPGNYRVYYFVKDKVTDIEWQDHFNLQVSNGIYEGWMVLNAVNNGSRLDMISLLEDTYTPKYDILQLTNSQLTLEGTPGFVECYSLNRNWYGIYVSTTGNGTTKLEPNTFEWKEAYNISYEFGTRQPKYLEIDNLIIKDGGKSFATFNGDVYYYFDVFRVSYSVPINTVNGVKFKASPMIGTGFWASNNAILFDETNQKFMFFNGSRCSDIPEAGSTLFNYNDTKKELTYMISNDFNVHRTFAILKDPTNGKSYGAIFDSTNFVQDYYAEITATDFHLATHYAISPVFGYLFYSVGGKVYQYDFYTKNTKLMIDKGSKEISLLKFQKFYGSSKYDNLAKQLIVGIYDASGTEGSNGSLELYTVPPVNGQIVLSESYDGFGKIKSISYRQR